MNKYQEYSAKDFVDDFRFRTWVRHPSPEEDAFWTDLISNHRYQQDVIAEARAIILAIHPVHDDIISDGELNDEIAQIMARVNSEHETVQRRSSVYLWTAAAASVIILVVVGWYAQQYSFDSNTNERSAETTNAPDNYMIERVNQGDAALLISLPDNSSVLLSQNSILRYPREFVGDSRNIVLEGTAFFEVTKDPNKPFYVNAGKVTAKVLGTSFEITTDQQLGQISVIVKSGTVSVYSNTDKDHGKDSEANVILTEHEQATFKDKVGPIRHTRLDSVSIDELKVPDTYLEFTATPASEALKSLAVAYKVQIDFTNADIGECSVTASFTDEPFPVKLALICRSIGVGYEIVNDHVTITGTGCQN